MRYTTIFNLLKSFPNTTNKCDELYSRVILVVMLSPKMRSQFVTLCAILGFLWLVMYAIPSLFVQIFDTAIGNALLLLAIAALVYKKRELGIIVGIVMLILYRVSHMSHGYMLL